MAFKSAVALIMLLALLTGCGEQTPEQAPPVVPAAPAEVDVTITNSLGDYDIVNILVDPSDEPWTQNRMGMDILEPGESFTVKVVPGNWDIMITDEDYDTYTLWQVEVGEAGFSWDVTLEDMDEVWTEEEVVDPVLLEVGEGDAFVEITNGLGGWDIFYVWVDPTNSQWGDDRLAADILMPGSILTVNLDPGVYDIRCEDEDGDTYTRWGIEVGPEGYFWTVTLDDWDL